MSASVTCCSWSRSTHTWRSDTASFEVGWKIRCIAITSAACNGPVSVVRLQTKPWSEPSASTLTMFLAAFIAMDCLLRTTCSQGRCSLIPISYAPHMASLLIRRLFRVKIINLYNLISPGDTYLTIDPDLRVIILTRYERSEGVHLRTAHYIRTWGDSLKNCRFCTCSNAFVHCIHLNTLSHLNAKLLLETKRPWKSCSPEASWLTNLLLGMRIP